MHAAAVTSSIMQLSLSKFHLAPKTFKLSCAAHDQLRLALHFQGGVGQDHVNPDFADSALLLPLNLYGEKRRPFRWANKTCRALL